jgi:hypothetical protein
MLGVDWREGGGLRQYGKFGSGNSRIASKTDYAHRVSWRIHFGEIPAGLIVCHRCDNPICVRPDHLFLGTHQDNIADMIAKGRHRSRAHPGEKNGRAKLTAEDVRTIRRLHAEGVTQYRLCVMFNLGDSHLTRIIQRRAWRGVEP